MSCQAVDDQLRVAARLLDTNFPNSERIALDLFDAEILAKTLISAHAPVGYTFGWMDEKTVNGRCYYGKRMIVLSRPLTALRTNKAVMATIMHEIAHALTPGAKHGRLWKLQMMKFGLPADRCSQDEVDKSSISNWVATCPGCAKVRYMIRRPRVVRSCGACSKGKYNEKYVLVYRRI